MLAFSCIRSMQMEFRVILLLNKANDRTLKIKALRELMETMYCDLVLVG